jgi:AraC-like DNA-binding protein
VPSRVVSPPPPPPPPCVLALTARAQLRALLRAALPRRRSRVHFVRSAADVDAACRTELVDAVIVDLAAGDDAWRAAALAREFPSAPFFAYTALRAADAPVLARCGELEFADVLVHGIDDGALAALILPAAFRSRLAAALAEPPEALQLDSPLERRSWGCIVAHAGRPVRTDAIARTVGVTREHLSREFAGKRRIGRCPARSSLKRVIDLVRLVAAAELAKNPGMDLAEVAAVLGFTSVSQLSTTAQRIVGVRAQSLARLRAVDLFERFA